MTAREAITAAMKKIGALATGEPLSAEDAADGLAEFNRMLSSWSAAGMPVYHIAHETFDLVAGTASYTIGAAADFVTTRPVSVTGAFIRDINGHDYYVDVRPISEYWLIGEKTTQSRPKWLYYDTTYPKGTIYLYYTPADAETLHLLSLKSLDEPAALVTALAFPEGYERAFVYNLAVELAPGFGRRIPPSVIMAAQESLATITGRNLASSVAPAQLNIPGVVRRAYNIEEG